ncbi:spinster family MFS transporter [Sphingosinicella microcystinivorans]|uniref:spinster family MFS transporter n=1 Tax=Sphingosinicella microcystinivorans TaxID=335406 RepID=UPI0022F396A4|nr:MFS transporter [Sphingosinicella microcystinivorans]WBX85208.1 MFS transporter [Sphingosinicella microcystinivorans]
MVAIEAHESLRYRYFVVAMLSLVYMLNFLDRQLLSILAEPIRGELMLTDTQLGLLTGFMFALFYTAFGVPVAWMADRVNRVRVVAAACALWSLFSAACGLAQNFTQLALARIGVGVGEAGGSPPSYSIIADYFPPERRGFALALYSLGVPLGTTAGAALGGWIAAVHGWRTAFIAIGLPGVLVALLLVLLVREPRRGRFETPTTDRPPFWQAIRTFFASRTLSLAAISASISGFVGYAMLAWTPAFLMRTKSMTLTEVAMYYSIVSGIASAVGILLSGYLVDRFGRRSPHIYGLVPAAALFVSLPFYIAGVNAETWQVGLAFFSVPFAMYITYLAPSLAVIQNTVPPNRRSTSSALLLFVINIVGLGGGPLFVGLVSDGLAPVYGDKSLGLAMLALSPLFLLAAGMHFAMSQTLQHVEA